LTAWLLLALRELGEGHGWGLVSQLRRSGVVVEPGRAYRILRSLEPAGLVSSRWTESVHGPRRRTYRITREGRQNLDQLAAHVTAVWQLNDAFVQAYERARVQGEATQSAECADDNDASGDGDGDGDGDDRDSGDPLPPRRNQLST